MPPAPERFKDQGYYYLLDKILAVCPQCAACAEIYPEDSGTKDAFAPRRLSCIRCGLLKRWEGNTIQSASAEAVDPYFNLPLWLQMPFEGNRLWAYNASHLALLEQYISAKHKERRNENGCYNAGLFSRMPEWFKSAKNRKKILQALEKLKGR